MRNRAFHKARDSEERQIYLTIKDTSGNACDQFAVIYPLWAAPYQHRRQLILFSPSALLIEMERQMKPGDGSTSPHTIWHITFSSYLGNRHGMLTWVGYCDVRRSISYASIPSIWFYC
jgi:hypothetical protein